MKKFLALFLVTSISGLAYAETTATTSAKLDTRVVAAEARENAPQKCEMKGEGFVSININKNNQTDVKQIKPMIDAEIEAVKALAEKAGIRDIELQSFNYNANSNSGGGCGVEDTKSFQVYGNFNFKVPADKAAEFMVQLVEAGHSANFNVNMNRQCDGYGAGD